MSSHVDSARLPVIDLSLFDVGGTWRDHVAAQVDWAAAEIGCFCIVGHGVEPAVIASMQTASRSFFDQPRSTKGPAQALYFREEPADSDVPAPAPALQRRNVFPELPGFREAVLDYMSALGGLAHRLMSSVGRGLRLGDSYFVDRYTGRPTTLFRILQESGERPAPGYKADGFLTLLYQEHAPDDGGGLQVKRGSRWVRPPFIPGSFVVSIGEVLERVTCGRYVSALHRVINASGQPHIVMPFSFGPRFDAVVRAIPPQRTPDRPAPSRAARA